MKNISCFLVLFSLIFCLSGNVGAAYYGYDFSTMGYTDGQSLEGMVKDYATFTSEDNGLRYYADYGAGIGTSYANGGAGDIYVTFSAPVYNLSFRGGDGGGDYDAFAVTLYAFGTDTFMGTWSTPLFDNSPNGPEWYTLDITASNVGRMVFDPGNSGILPGTLNGLGGIILTDFGYNQNPVPIPAAVWLFGSGLLGLFGVRRKLRK